MPAAQPLHALLLFFQLGDRELALTDLLVDLAQIPGTLGPELGPLGRPRLDIQPLQSLVAAERSGSAHTDWPMATAPKVAILLAGLWLLSPIDLLPEFLPVIGPLDDVVVVALALRYAARRVPREVLLEAWPADPRLLQRLLGPPTTPIKAG